MMRLTHQTVRLFSYLEVLEITARYDSNTNITGVLAKTRCRANHI